MWFGFVLASYSVVGNDVIQTLGTFLSSNEKKPWWILWIFAGTILTVTLLYSWYTYNGDVSYARLIGGATSGYSFDNPKYELPDPFSWYFLIPPIILVIITRFGIPVSTSFLILTFFLPKGLEGMVIKSISGYGVAFLVAIVIYMIVSRISEKKFIDKPVTREENKIWVPLQWLSTGFLWSQWLIQDFANIYVYLPRRLDATELFLSLIIILTVLALIFYVKGGKMQKIIRGKTNTHDIRSATIIDLIYGLVLLFFKEYNNLPMSTSWVFLGLLAGRELAIVYRLYGRVTKKQFRPILTDLAKVTFGLLISVLLVFALKYFEEFSAVS